MDHHQTPNLILILKSARCTQVQVHFCGMSVGVPVQTSTHRSQARSQFRPGLCLSPIWSEFFWFHFLLKLSSTNFETEMQLYLQSNAEEWIDKIRTI